MELEGLWALIGAVVGSLVGGGVTFLTVRWQTKKLLDDERDRARVAREEEHQGWLRRREEQALANLLPVLSELETGANKLWALDIAGKASPRIQFAEYVLEEAEQLHKLILHGQRVDLPLVISEELRSRYRTMVKLAEDIARLDNMRAHDERVHQTDNLRRYIGHVRHSIKNALHGQPLPPAAPPPVITYTADRALWTPPETDPEDTYYPTPTRTDG